MIEATMKPELLKQIVDSVSELMTEVHMVFSESGLEISQMTADRSTLIGMTLSTSDFESYNCTKGREVILGLDRLSKLVKDKRLSGVTEIVLSNDEDGPDGSMVSAVFVGENKRKSFSLPMLARQPDYKDVVIPRNLKFESEFELMASSFESAVDEVAIVSSQMQLLIDDKRITAKGRGGDSSEAKIVFELGEELKSINKMVDQNQPLAAKFNVGALKGLVKAFASNGHMMMKMSHQKPVWFEMSLGESGELILILSPVLPRRNDE